MFQSAELKQHLEESSSISVNSFVSAEWNMNIATNIAKIGNYRFRPAEPDSIYNVLPNSYDPLDAGSFYTNATDSDVVVDGGLDAEDLPIAFISKKEKEKLLFSLEDCLYRFRPRSGINKLRYLDNRYLHHTNPELARRPRYYMADKNDSFKYWTSYRTEAITNQIPSESATAIERGIASKFVGGRYFIDDAVPFVVYTNPVPANRIVVKLQTHVGDIDLGPFRTASGLIEDPLFGIQNQQTPVIWKIQYLSNNAWLDAASFDELSIRPDGSRIIGHDGYVELAYGLILPDQYLATFKYFGELLSEAALPESNIDGAGYLIKNGLDDIGYFKIYDGVTHTYSDPVIPRYGWRIHNESLDSATPFVTDLTNPSTYVDIATQTTKYREFEYVSGIRIVAQTMNKPNSTFDLIEFSPRLAVDLSDKITGFSVTKSISETNNTGLPVGELMASTGSISLFDYDLAFSSVNNQSIVKDYLSSHIQFKFYEVVTNVNEYDYYVPIKTMYSEGFPELDVNNRDVLISTRDLYFYFESLEAPEIFIQNVSLSYAISLLLDSIGFSNYAFFRIDGEDEPVIPNFFIPPQSTVASVLSDLAISTQYAMFFDEFNNFIVMSKNYVMASEEQRSAVAELSSVRDFEKDGIVLNSRTEVPLSNIIEAAASDTPVYNAGKVIYTSRYIQKSYASINQSNVADRDKTWVYKPVLLWEATGTETTKSINNEGGNAAKYTLSAIPLSSDLSDKLPSVENGVIINNVIDFGEPVYFMSRYNGYFFANGEIIRYDAIEFSVSGPQLQDSNGNNTSVVWVQSQKEYENLFSKLAFNGKIFPTGRVRIYSEPRYETVNGQTKLSNGPVAKHGRGQFGTTVSYHPAGLNQHWTNTSNIKAFKISSFGSMISTYAEKTANLLSAQDLKNKIASVTISPVANLTAIISGFIKNFLSKSSTSESEALNSYTPESSSVQSSALIMQGASQKASDSGANPSVDYLSYVSKQLDSSYSHFGTRMRIIGKIENSEFRGQTPSGSTNYYTILDNADPSKSIAIGGGSGGIGVFINPSNNFGYYFELIALTSTNVESFVDSNIYNVLFWKTSSSGTELLYGGITQIVVDTGTLAGQYRFAGEERPTVYDIAVEYQNVGSTKRFYLYLNNQIIATVDDASPLPVYNNVALFVRGSARIMFENIYALSNNYAQNTSFQLDTPINNVFGDTAITANEAFRKYAMSGMIQSTYLSGIGPNTITKNKMYFDEFGTIMREAAYFNIKYDKAYPAIYAKITPSFNRIKGYTISGFRAGAYGAEFLIFNNTDTVLSLDSKNGNSLTIQGVTFTQAADNSISVDDYFDKLSDFSNPEFYEDNTVRSPDISKEIYDDIRNSRIVYGRNEFAIAGSYIQDYDSALELMDWIIPKISKPRKSLGLKVFGMPILQLGDIVTIKSNNIDGIAEISDESSRFVIYHIEYTYSFGGPETTLYLSEVK